jgi:1-deoxy-D-xylulose-5-phosphate synthase
MQGPVFLHVVTRKGQGYKLAEADPVLYHGPGKFDLAEGIKAASGPAKPTYTKVFSDWVCDMAAIEPKLVAITPAMREGSGLVEFEKRFPDRYFDVGIAEQHAVTFAAGLACEGMKPVVAIYSTFLQRAYDQLIHDVALQNLPVVFALDRAGLVGADGATHAGAYDLAYLRCVPNMVVMAPADENECRQMLFTATRCQSPAAVRYPRGSGVGVPVVQAFTELPLGKAEVRRKGRRLAILAFGSMVGPAVEAGKALDATVVNMRFVKPIDTDLIAELAATHEAFVTVEEHVVMGGAGSACAEALAQLGVAKPVLHLGLPDRFIDHGDHALLLKREGLDAAGLETSVRARFADLLSGDAGRTRLVASR